jgi:hypothetical protein
MAPATQVGSAKEGAGQSQREEDAAVHHRSPHILILFIPIEECLV